MNSENVLQLGCPHIPKQIKKSGIFQGLPCIILLCSECKTDPDLANFQEKKI